jgi:hypothetical protein
MPDKKMDITEIVKSILIGKEIESDLESVGIFKTDEEERLVYGVVIEPMTDVTKYGDAHGDRMTESEIKKSAQMYMRNHQTMKLQHTGGRIDAYPVESYIAPVDFEMNGEQIKKGSWVMVTKVESDDLWQTIKEGKVTAYSPGGKGYRKKYEPLAKK